MIAVVFLPGARVDLSQAVDRYDTELSGLGDAFITEVETSVARLVKYPMIGARYVAGTRRLLLDRFPFSIVYEIQQENIVIVAIAHHRRRPGYWRQR